MYFEELLCWEQNLLWGQTCVLQRCDLDNRLLSLSSSSGAWGWCSQSLTASGLQFSSWQPFVPPGNSPLPLVGDRYTQEPRRLVKGIPKASPCWKTFLKTHNQKLSSQVAYCPQIHFPLLRAFGVHILLQTTSTLPFFSFLHKIFSIPSLHCRTATRSSGHYKDLYILQQTYFLENFLYIFFSICFLQLEERAGKLWI